MCLQKTPADQVKTVFERLTAIAPNPAKLLDRRDQAENILNSAGLKSRVRKIFEVAGALVMTHGGKVPETREQLLALPGVQDYVASAVLSFGFRKRSILLDTNTERIVARLRMDSRARSWQRRLDIYRIAGREGADSAFNYALLDLGALICHHSKPLCSECPVRGLCEFGKRRGGLST
jgi:A/G-specific adenine glycosylase